MKTKQKNSSINKYLKLCIFAIVFIQIVNSYVAPSSCTSNSKYYNILTLECTDCPANTERATDKAFCNCTNSFYPNWDAIGFNHPDSCKTLGATYIKNTQVLTIYDQTGLISPAAVTCAANSIPKFDQNKCQSCGYDSKLAYNTSLKACQCASGYIKIGQSCYQQTITWSRNFSSTDSFNFLAEQNVKIGCQQQNLVQPCNMLINMCVKAEYSNQNYFCTLLSSLSTGTKTSLPTYKFSSKLTDSIGIYASSIIGVNTTTVKNQLSIFSIEYDIYGAIRQIAPLDKQLFQCDISDQDVAKFSSFGLNMYKFCTSQRSYNSESYYDFYVQNSQGKYSQVPIYISGVYYKRLSPSTAVGSHTFKLQFVSQPPLLVPILSFSTSSVSLAQTSSTSSQVSLSTIIPFAIFNVGIFIVFVLVYYRYIQYNPSEDPNDPYFLCKGLVTLVIKLFYTWGYGLWIWLFGFSLYAFSFYKFQQTIYLILPDQQTYWQSYYQLFMIIFYAQLVIVAISLWIVFYNLSEIDYFMIDWEKQKDIGKFEVGKQKKEVSVWRKVLLVNQLYELAVSHNINKYFVTLFALLFLRGLEWINLSFTIPNTTNLTQLESTTTQSGNVILAYFIITFIFFIIAALQHLIRNLISTWYALPAQNFVDLCAVTNISILMFNQYLHGYYIHGVNPSGRSEGSLQHIQNMFEKQSKSFGKSRGFRLEDHDACQTFQAVFPISIRRGFQMRYKAPLMQKMVPKLYQNQSVFSNPLPDDWDETDYDQIQKMSSTMIQSFKMYLQNVKSSLRNVRDRSWWEKFVSFPISQQIIGGVPVFLKDKWNDFTNSFLSGHQYLILFNFINFVNLWYIVTKNIYFASLLAIIVNQLIFNLPATFFIKRNISKNSLIDQKFFN